MQSESTAAARVGYFLVASAIVWTTMIYGAVHQPILALFYIAIAAIFVCWAVDGIRGGYFRFDGSLFQFPLLAAAIYGVIQIIPFGLRPETGGVADIPATISMEPFATQVTAFHFFALFLFLAAALVFIDSRKRLKSTIRLITIFGFAFAFFAILQAILSPTKIYGIYSTGAAVSFGSFVNRHNFAAFMEMSMAVPLGLLVTGAITKDKRLLYYTAIAVMGIALLLSGSRGGLVSICAGVGFLIFVTYSQGSKRGLFVKIASVAMIAAAVTAGAVLIGGENSFTRIAETAASSDFTTNRTQIWSVSLDVIRNNQPFGVGMGAFGVSYSKYDPFNGIERVEQAHNDYLEVLAVAGLVGALIGIAFIFLLFRDGLRAVKTRDKYLRGAAAGALSGCFAILVHSLFDFVLHTTAVALLFLILAALCGVCLRLAESRKEKPESGPVPASVTPITKNAST